MQIKIAELLSRPKSRYRGPDSAMLGVEPITMANNVAMLTRRASPILSMQAYIHSSCSRGRRDVSRSSSGRVKDNQLYSLVPGILYRYVDAIIYNLILQNKVISYEVKCNNDMYTVYAPSSGVPRFPIPRSANSSSPLRHHDLYGKQQLRRRCRAPLKAILRLMALRFKACILYIDPGLLI